MAGSSSSGGDDDYTVRETDPTGQYTRYRKKIDEDDLKKVYLGYDRLNGREVAWMKMSKRGIDAEKQAYLMRLHHSNVLKCYSSWDNQETDTLDQITEFYSGNLSDFIENHTNFSGMSSLAAIQNWCLQIIEAFLYLHEQNIVVIQNNLRIGNLYIVGESGTVKIGDLSDATFLTAEAVLQMGAGDPASDAAGRAMHEEIEIFGQCVLQMVSKALKDKLIPDKQCKNFIKSCFLPGDNKPTVYELLQDPFITQNYATRGGCSDTLSLLSAMGIGTERQRYILKGRSEDNGLIHITLKMRNIRHHFSFSLRINRVLQVMESLKEDLGLSDEETTSISDGMGHLLIVFVSQYGVHERRTVVVSGSVSSPRIAAEQQNREQPESEGAIDDSDTASASEDAQLMAESEGTIDDSNTAAASEDARLMAERLAGQEGETSDGSD